MNRTYLKKDNSENMLGHGDWSICTELTKAGAMSPDFLYADTNDSMLIEF